MKAVISKYNDKIIGLKIDNVGNTVDVMASDVSHEFAVNDIYCGIVSRIVSHLNACFVDIAKDVTCFVSLKDYPYEKYPVQGEIMPVQIIRKALKTKEITAGFCLEIADDDLAVSFDLKNTKGVSKKITDSIERERLKKIISDSNSSYSVILRTNAKEKSEEELESKIKQYSDKLDNILIKSKTRTKYSLLYKAVPEYISFIKPNEYSEIEIITDDYDIYSNLIENIKDSDIKLYNNSELSLNVLYSIKERIENITKRKVYLNCGGYLIVDQTEALNVIDVNAGKIITRKNQEEATRQINIEAAIEAARQIRLRNLSGIIIIDFINLNHESEAELISIMKKELAKDSIKSVVVDITKLGLMEITRLKTAPSLSECFR